MATYQEIIEFYKAFCKVDLGEFCLHHIYRRIFEIKTYGETWMPVNCSKEFAALASKELNKPVIETDETANDDYYKAGYVRRLILNDI